MNCERFDEIVTDLAREQIMDASLRQSALAHQSECVDCGTKLGDELSLSQGLKMLALSSHDIRPTPEIADRLLMAFRDGAATRPGQRTSWVFYRAAAIAAVLLIAVALFGLWMRRHPQPVPREVRVSPMENVTPRETPKDKSTVVRVNPGDLGQAPIPIRHRQGHTPRYSTTVEIQNAHVAQSEVATEFFPIGSANPVALEQGGEIVRVELPSYALARFGLPVNLDRADERVKADVLLGTDGQAHAIRFIR